MRSNGRRLKAAHAQYPALAAWKRRDGNKPESQWITDDLWRAAIAEADAMQHRDNPAREREYQIEAMLALLFGKSVGDPPGKKYPPVTLTVEWQRQYMTRINAA